MPELAPQVRAQGAYVGIVEDPHDGSPCVCDWSVATSAVQLRHRPLPLPDQSRYGRATTDPLGRDAPEWRIGRHGLPVREEVLEDD